MMEDSSLDWEKLEYEGEVEKGSGFGWVLSKGLNLGKNLVITGVVVSSVPIVVPPLLVVSALGFAFSVPFGFMYASYTCTEKLMSKLLPATSSPHVIEFGEGKVVGSEEKGKEQLYDEFNDDMIVYQEELGNDIGEVMLVKESEEGLSTVGEFGEDFSEEGLRYDDANRREEGLGTVSELGKDEERLLHDGINRREEVSDSKPVPVLIQHVELVDLKDDSVHVEGNGLLRNKDMPDDEEIWKQIESIRTIVGFKVARHTSYFEELKALYVFTGIEPPSLFKDPFDTAEVCDKLRFLMSVIGVK